MPIKPENKSRYPADWKHIRAAILERAGNKCEKCGAPNGEVIVRGCGDDEGRYMTVSGAVFDAESGEPVMLLHAADFHPSHAVKVVLTIAHLGLPAHLPVQLHVTRSTETNEVFKIIGFFMPLNAEVPEWHLMMHRRALAEFCGGPSAFSTRFFVTFPGSIPSPWPGASIMHEAVSMAPETIILTDWRLLGEPRKTAGVSTETAPVIQVPSADLEIDSAPFTGRHAEAALAAAYGFIAAGRRACLNSIGRLLRSDREVNAANYAIHGSSALARRSANPGSLYTFADMGFEDTGTRFRTGMTFFTNDIREGIPADNTGNGERAFAWSGHAKLYHDDEYPENCDPANLRAWCQRCHLRYDAQMHAGHARETRRSRAAVADLFGG